MESPEFLISLRSPDGLGLASQNPKARICCGQICAGSGLLPMIFGILHMFTTAYPTTHGMRELRFLLPPLLQHFIFKRVPGSSIVPRPLQSGAVSYTHLRAHETDSYL